MSRTAVGGEGCRCRVVTREGPELGWAHALPDIRG
jgi:hypothetical protein